MNGTPEELSPAAFVSGRGTGSGTLGLDVADVGRGGRERMSGVSPGIRSATTLLMERGFWEQLLDSEMQVVDQRDIPQL